MSVTAKNPIMPGFYPDPSICAVGDDYYMVHSTFSYFPGLPILHSKDLAHWEQIGNAMHRQEQLPLKNSGHSQGLFAPTIRYNNGVFYVICTNVSYGGNYFVTATNPAGPWSNPIYIEGAEGIDPSLFFDEDGKCYYIGTHPNPDGVKYNGDWFIWIQELDVVTGKLVGEVHDVWNGAMKNIIWPEGPHLYKVNGYYYIMHAEGGTGPDHAVTVCRSKNVFGPYENNFCNPILTHRHLGQDYPIKYVGHADMIQTPAGEWYMVMLAVRPVNRFTTMGRETFLAKVTWENDWPVVNAGYGMLTDEVEINLPEWNPSEDDTYDSSCNAIPGSNRIYEFAKMNRLGDEFLMLRNPGDDLYELVPGEGLKLSFRDITLKEQDSPSYLCIRQQHHYFAFRVSVAKENLTSGKRAGMALVQSNEYHLRVELAKITDKKCEVRVIVCKQGEDQCIADREVDVAGKMASITITVDGLVASIAVEGQIVSEQITVSDFSTEVAGGFVGCTVGMYAVADTDDRKQAALFGSMSYQAL